MSGMKRGDVWKAKKRQLMMVLDHLCCTIRTILAVSCQIAIYERFIILTISLAY